MLVSNNMDQAVDTSGQRWMINEMVTLNFGAPATDPFSEVMRVAEMEYIRSLIPNSAPTYVRAHKSAIDAFLKHHKASDLMLGNGSEIVPTIYEDWTRKYDYNVVVSRLRCITKWYSWCSDRGFEHFDIDVASTMGSWSYAGTRTGKAVLRLDPDGGPLTESEAASFNRALWAEFQVVRAGDRGRLPLRIIVACLLMSALGPNPVSLRQLEESDLRAPARPGDPFVLMMPRGKKVGVPWRGAFRERVLSPELGKAVQALIQENRRLAPTDGTDETRSRPLFRRQKQGERLRDTVLFETVHRVHVHFFHYATQKAVEALDLRNRQGARLAVSPRRLRYTVTKRLVARGATPVQVMDILDHASISSVMIYFNCGLEMVPHLDKSLGSLMRAMTTLFEGRHAPMSGPLDPALAPLFRARRKSEGAIAPMRCLTCPKFQARDGDALRRLAVIMGAGGTHPSEESPDQVRRALEAARACDGIA